MKAVILAAGRGARLNPFTKDKPKCLLEIGGKSILEWQFLALREAGIQELVIVKGYRGSMITAWTTNEYWNYEYDSSNMIASLFCAEDKLQGDLLIVYADILFERRLLRSLLEAPPNDIVTLVDVDWKPYYTKRFGTPFQEAESLSFDAAGRLLRIGDENPREEEVQGRFIGLLRLSGAGTKSFRDLFFRSKSRFWEHPWMRGRSLKMAYMTDFLQALIDQGTPVFSAPVNRGWIELDSATDYLKLLKWHKEGTLKDIFRFDR